MNHHYFFNVIPSTLMDLLHLGTFYNNEEVDLALCEWLRMKGPDLCSHGVFKHLPRWEKMLHWA
jgi:hypothetical protein